MILELFLGLLIGAALVYFWRAAISARQLGEINTLREQLSSAAAASSAAEERLQAAQDHYDSSLHQQANAADRLLSETKQSFELRLADERSTRERILVEFRAAAGETLKESTKQFLDGAIKDLRQVKTETDTSVTQQQKLITTSVADMKSSIDEVQKLVKLFEAERGELYGSLAQQLTQLATAGQSWQQEAASLRTVLSKGSATIGNWGELVLRNIFTACNLREGIDYEEQVHVYEDKASLLKPDFVVKLPQGGHRQVIDAKSASLETLLRAEQTTDPKERAQLEMEFAKRVKIRVDELAGKEYQKQIDQDIPYVVMFIPSEAAIRVAFNADPELFRYAMTNKIIIASPATIMPLLLLIARSWQQNEFAVNAQQLGSEIETLGERLFKFAEHLDKMTGAISNTVKHWNNAVGSWQSRVIPQLEKARQLGAALPAELSDGLTAIPEEPRPLLISKEEANNTEQVN